MNDQKSVLHKVKDPVEISGRSSGGHCAVTTPGLHLAVPGCAASSFLTPSPGAAALGALRTEGSPAGAHAHLSRAGAERRLALPRRSECAGAAADASVSVRREDGGDGRRGVRSRSSAEPH